jgi:hypothetical protein
MAVSVLGHIVFTGEVRLGNFTKKLKYNSFRTLFMTWLAYVVNALKASHMSLTNIGLLCILGIGYQHGNCALYDCMIL